MSRAWLEAGVAAVRVGGNVPMALVIRVPPGFHTYADPPGDAGMPPDLKLELPEGWQRTPLRFPPAQRFDEQGIVSFGYTGVVRLPFDLLPPPHVRPGKVTVHGRLDWVSCRESCIPHFANLAASFRVR